MVTRTLTHKEKILLHLFDFNRYAEEYVAPPQVTQEGIAKAVSIRRHHVTQYVRPLRESEEVEEGSKHVEGKSRHLKVYFLTWKGRQHTAALRESILQGTVPFRWRDGETETLSLAKVFQEHRRGATLLELLEEERSLGYVSEQVREPEAGVVEFTEETPPVEAFYGREAELQELTAALQNGPTVVVMGMAGIGKTTMGAKACEALRGDFSLFWRQIRPWDSATDLAFRVATFLKALGRVALSSYLSGTGTKTLGQMEELLADDLIDLRALFVFDDVHEALEDAAEFLALFHRVARPHRGAALLLLSRGVPEFYSRRDVSVEGSVREFRLAGLDAASSQKLLLEAGIEEPLVKPLARAGGGNPLFLWLLVSAGGPAAEVGDSLTIETYIAEQIEPALREEERGCLEIASLYQLPVPAEALLLEGEVRQATIVSVLGKGLLGQVDAQTFLLHDSLRAYFQGGLSRSRRAGLVERVVGWLHERGRRAAREGHPNEAIRFLGNAISVEVEEERVVQSLELLARYRRWIGDLPGAVEVYRVALTHAKDPATRARLHRKLAASLSTQGLLEEAENEIATGVGLVAEGPTLERAWLLKESAVVAFRRQDFGSAYDAVERARGMQGRLGEDWDLIGYLSNLRGLILQEDSQRLDYPLAYADMQEAIQAFQRSENLNALCYAYNNLALAALHLGRPEEAWTHIERSGTIAETSGFLPGRQVALFTKAFLLTDGLGDYAAAEKLYQETYELAKASHLRQRVIWHAKYFADLYRKQGRFEEAKESLGYFLEASEEMINAETRIAHLSLLARLGVACQDLESAEAALRQAEDLLEESPTAHARHVVQWARASIHAAAGDAVEARDDYQAALEAGGPGDLGEFLLEYGRFLLSVKEGAQAREVLTRAESELAKSSKPMATLAREALASLDSE